MTQTLKLDVKSSSSSTDLSKTLASPKFASAFSRKSAITEEQLDLTVDYDSEVEDALPPRINTRVGKSREEIEACIEWLAYDRSRFSEYYRQGKQEYFELITSRI